MLSVLKNLFSKTPEKPFLPGIFRNPLAEKVSWKPQKSGGANYRNRELVKGDSQKLLYKGTKIAYFFSFLFMIGPLVFISFHFFIDKTGDWKNLIEFPFVLIIPIIFGVGGVTLYSTYKPKVFDKKLGYYYSSYKKVTSQREVPDSKKWIKIDTIEAIQIIKERVRTKNSSYDSYELNLVLNDASRVNVVDHSKYEQIKEDARMIADFIGIPYWDAVNKYLYEPKNPRRELDLDTDYDSTPRFREM